MKRYPTFEQTYGHCHLRGYQVGDLVAAVNIACSETTPAYFLDWHKTECSSKSPATQKLHTQGAASSRPTTFSEVV